jgi:polysaccharide export outer membrane protein
MTYDPAKRTQLETGQQAMNILSRQSARSMSLYGLFAMLTMIAVMSGTVAARAASPLQATTQATAQVTAPVPGPASPVAAIDSTADYVLGTSDKIRVTVYGEPSLTGEYFVSTSGTVNLPLAGDVQASGLTLRDFRDKLTKALQDGYLKDPKISIEILTFRPFYILGEVIRPGQYPYTNGLTVFNAVATAGGFTYRANTRKVFIKKATDTQEREIPLTSQTAISPGDTVRVPERFF